MLLGQARGKIGDLVFSRTSGQQVVRARAAVIRNPQSESQMIQRIILATVGLAYSRMQAIVDHSFEGRKVGQETMSTFMSKNIKALRERVVAAANDPLTTLAEVRSFTPVGTQVFAANNYQVSQGTLPAVVIAGFTGSTAAKIAVAANTYAAVAEQYNLQRGDQLTLVQISGVSASNRTFDYARIILDPRDASGNELPMSTALVGNNNQVNMPSTRNTGSFATLSFADGMLSFNVGGAATTAVSMAAVIVSRQSASGTWLRSTAFLMANDNALYTDSYSMQEALDFLSSDNIGVASPLYLNNAGATPLANAQAETITVRLSNGGTAEIVGVRLAAQAVSGNTPVEAIMADGSTMYIKCAVSGAQQEGKWLATPSMIPAETQLATDAVVFDNTTDALWQRIAALGFDATDFEPDDRPSGS